MAAMQELEIFPEVIYRGSSVISMKLPRQRLQIIDSYLFLQSRLADLPTMFGFNDTVEKGSFKMGKFIF